MPAVSIRSAALLVVLAGTFLVLGGCSSSSESVERKSIRDYEGSFDPSQYREEEKDVSQTQEPSVNAVPETETRDEEVTIERIEQTMGYRVQIFSTTSIDDAEQRRDDYREMLGDTVAINIVFDAPYFKIRVGDFLTRGDADTECSRLKESGLKEAWVVRDKVNRVITETVIKRR